MREGKLIVTQLKNSKQTTILNHLFQKNTNTLSSFDCTDLHSPCWEHLDKNQAIPTKLQVILPY